MDYGTQTVFMNEVLNNYFSSASNYSIYVGLGLSNEGGATNTDTFTEPDASAGYAKKPFVASTAVDGITYNSTDIVFDTATAAWTTDDRVIDKVGLFNKTETTSGGTTVETYTLWCVLPLNPSETVVAGDTVIINANTLRLQLTNK